MEGGNCWGRLIRNDWKVWGLRKKEIIYLFVNGSVMGAGRVGDCMCKIMLNLLANKNFKKDEIKWVERGDIIHTSNIFFFFLTIIL